MMSAMNAKSVVLLLGLALSSVMVMLPATASARPCCQSCDGWPDAEPPMQGQDPCWDSCYICTEGGHECQSNNECGGGGLYVCMGGYCVFWGNEPFAVDEVEPEPSCSNGVSNLDGTTSCFDI